MKAPTVFLVGADPAVCEALTTLVESARLQAETFRSLQAFLDAVPSGRRGCLVVDADHSDLNGWEQPAILADLCAAMPVILLIATGDIPMAVRGLKAGTLDIVEKPYTTKRFLDGISRALAANAAASR